MIQQIKLHYELTVVGVTFTDRIKMELHVRNQIKKSNRSLYAIKIIKNRRSNPDQIYQIYSELILNRLLRRTPFQAGEVSQTKTKRSGSATT